MTTIGNIRSACNLVAIKAFGLFGIGAVFFVMTRQFSRDLPEYSRFFMAEATGFCMAGLIGGAVFIALRTIVNHFESLESELAKFLKNEADPKSAAQAFAKFLRAAKSSKE